MRLPWNVLEVYKTLECSKSNNNDSNNKKTTTISQRIFHKELLINKWSWKSVLILKKSYFRVSKLCQIYKAIEDKYID